MDIREITIDYSNWRGDRRVRKIVPDELVWNDATKWHGEAQWILWATDLEDGVRKAFAMKRIHRWGDLLDEEPK